MEIVTVNFTRREARALLYQARGHSVFSPNEKAAFRRAKDKLALGLLAAGPERTGVGGPDPDRVILDDPAARRGSYARHEDEFPDHGREVALGSPRWLSEAQKAIDATQGDTE